ncbi:methyltransferase domain-containing protein [Rhodohalobacter sp. SW132]|uniref:class I SAM-dependent methyltransferase n=1 Tax=Rhodohalobacter sp. SW132 TaxID=2293433 RepID=UPI000E26A89E|nr:class I SAM-dependent methyltransferase [Rhodohalobacter sp. SW132]REL24873.1 methyltransferase domain-containing protein [Rhodohalobacter sp. SW132]
MEIKRYPPTSNRSLRAWSAADEYVLSEINKREVRPERIAILNDRFGYVSCHLSEYHPIIVTDRKSQEKSIRKNFERNGLDPDNCSWLKPLDPISETVDLCIISIPKSMDRFKLYLHQAHQLLSDTGEAIGTFMTRYFTPKMLEISEEYFEEVNQSLARKKSRLLLLKGKQKSPSDTLIEQIPYQFPTGETETLRQYYGVFSSGVIDYATQFLLANLKLRENETKVMDLGTGNGVIARAVQLSNPKTELHLTDDSFLALESAKLNLETEMCHFHWSDTLDHFAEKEFDLVLSNPPFHLGHEINIEVTTRLFGEVKGVLKDDGRFVSVSNNHLNYKTHLEKHFSVVQVIAKNDKFTVYESRGVR